MTQHNRGLLLSDLATLPGEDRLARLSDALRAAMQAVTLFAQLQQAQYYAMSQDTLRQVAAACGDDFEALWATLNAPSLEDRLAALDATLELLAVDLDAIFEQYASDEQALELLQEEQTLLQQEIDAVFAKLAEQEPDST